MDIQATTEDLENAIRLTLRFELGWSPDEARGLAILVSSGVTRRLEEWSAK